MHVGKTQHFWVYMGIDVDTGVEYSCCDRCWKFRYTTKDGFVYISKKEYDKRVEECKVKIE